MNVDGACHCGAITYQADIYPNPVVICHCSDCQTFSSAPYRVSVFGTALYSTKPEHGSPLNLRVGAIKQRDVMTPKMQRFCGSAMPWAMDIRDIHQVPETTVIHAQDDHN